MILTCPSCGTQYVVKDGAIPATGRQVRCKACQHSWREFPPTGEALELDREVAVAAEPVDEAREAVDGLPEDTAGEPVVETLPEDTEVAESEYDRDEALPEDPGPPPIPPEADVGGLAEAAPSNRLEWVQQDDDFSPFAPRDAGSRPRSRILLAAVGVLLIAAIVAGLWFFAPPELRERLGIASQDETPLQLMMTHSDRTQLASGNEFLNISGRIINPTDRQQNVPPIHAQLLDASGKVVYKWTIPPPIKSIPPGGSTSFNSAELNIPPAAQELTVTLGEPKI